MLRKPAPHAHTRDLRSQSLNCRTGKDWPFSGNDFPGAPSSSAHTDCAEHTDQLHRRLGW